MIRKKTKNTKTSQPPEKIDTLIGEGTLLEGNMLSSHSLRIDGKVIGDISTEGTIHIGDKGEVQGAVKAMNVILSGKVQGNVEAKETLRITDGGKLLGDGKIKTLIVDENGFFEGNSKMHQGEGEPEKGNTGKPKEGFSKARESKKKE